MKKKITIILFDAAIVLVIISLYVLTTMYIYNSFRERKRKEIRNDIIEKVDEKIAEIKQEIKENENNDNNSSKVSVPTTVTAKYNNFNYAILGKIKINKIDIYEPILRENTKKAYDTAVVMMSGPGLNKNGNVSIGGHNYMKGNYFIKINKLVQGDIITITDLSGNSIDYYVYEYNTTTIDDANYLKQPSDKKAKEITLVTCTKGGGQRYYVKARAK